MAQLDAIEVASTKVSCDGGSSDLGHPLVFLEMGSADEVTCPYCGRRFILKEGARAAMAAH